MPALQPDRATAPPADLRDPRDARDPLIAERADLLARAELFAELDRVTLARLAAHLQPVAVADGAAVFRQDEAADGLYVVSRGTFAVVIAAPGGVGSRRMSTLRRGDCFGEMALLIDGPRSATILAEGDGEVLWLERSRFHDLLRREPRVARTISVILSRRLGAADRALHEQRDRSESPVAEAAAPEPADLPVGAAPAGPAGSLPGPSAVLAGWVAHARWRRRPGRTLVGVGLAAAVLAVGWLVAPPAGLSATAWHALVTLVAAVPLLALGSLPEGLIALGLAGVWIVAAWRRPAWRWAASPREAGY